mmetsp:Transcript_20/g.14  ORF Transcript_20/g.14 Transcript_20/m.14 type:complete len:84 (-) Transcript_20:65-316(-)
MQGLGAGIIRAIGYQHFASVIQFVSMWVILVPLAYFIGFTFDYGFYGLWVAAPAGPFCSTTSYLAIIFIVNWTKLAKKSFGEE